MPRVVNDRAGHAVLPRMRGALVQTGPSGTIRYSTSWSTHRGDIYRVFFNDDIRWSLEANEMGARDPACVPQGHLELSFSYLKIKVSQSASVKI